MPHMGYKLTVDMVLGRGNYAHLAKLTGIERSHIRRVLRGERDVSLSKAIRIANAAGVSLETLANYIQTNSGQVL